MGKSLGILLIFLWSGFNTFAQNKLDSLYIAGSIEVLVGFNRYTPEDYTFILDGPVNKIIELDSKGNFLIENLEPGKYTFDFWGFGSSKIDTQIVVKNHPVEGLNLLSIADCVINELEANRDIEVGKPRLLIQGGIAPVIFWGQEVHEKKYGFKYEDFGCVSPGSECMVDYNFQVFKYLDEKFGESWREEIRSDVMGLSQWLDKN